MTIDEQTERDLKTSFAGAWLSSPDDPFKAAFSIFADPGIACKAATVWIKDAFVKAEKIRLLEENGLKAFLPTKEDQAKDVYEMATDKSLDQDIRIKAHRLYAEIMGNIEKPDQRTNVNILNQTVMTVPIHGTNEEWEQRAKDQQHALIYGDAAAAN